MGETVQVTRCGLFVIVSHVCFQVAEQGFVFLWFAPYRQLGPLVRYNATTIVISDCSLLLSRATENAVAWLIHQSPRGWTGKGGGGGLKRVLSDVMNISLPIQ